MNTRQLTVPFIEGLEKMDSKVLFTALEEKGSRFFVDQVNWPEAFPYAPLCAGEVARGQEHLAIHFHVRGLDLRAMNMEDNGRQWEDSCCEFFVEDPVNGKYYNFEINCLGKILAAGGADRRERPRRPVEEMNTIRRISGMGEDSEGFNHSDSVWVWDVTVLIPFRLIGADPENLPEKLRANFYKCGDKTAHPHYVSWNRIDTPKPNFHCPEFFGELILKNE